MSRLFLIASRGLALAALSLLLAVSPEGNAQGDRPQGQTEPTDTAKKVSRLTAELKDQSYWPDQYRAAEALGELGPAAKDAVPALVAALKDPSLFVRMAAARALGKVGSVSPEALVALKAAAKDNDPYVRRAVTEAFGSLVGKATKEEVPALIAALKAAAKDNEPLVRDAATEAFERIRKRLVGKATKADVPVLIAALKDPEPFIRRDAAARALGKVGSISPEALAALKAAAKDDDPDVRRAATEAFESLVGKATKEEVPVLVAALKDPEPIVRQTATRALGKVGSISPEALVALKAAETDDDPNVRRAATEASERIRERLVGKATKADVPVLIAALKDPEPLIRRDAAARALGKVGSISPEVLAALKAAAKDNEPLVRDAATEACESLIMGKATKEDVPALIAALKDAEPFIRRAAARALGKVGSPFASPEALSALKTATKDNEPEVRRTATEAWESIPPALRLQLAAILELERGSKKGFHLQLYRHKVEGPVLVKFEGLPTGVLIPEVRVPADKNEAQFEVTVGNDAPPGTEQEMQVLATAAGVKSESRALIYLKHAPPSAEAYLRLGRLAEGEAALLERLKNAPQDGPARFGLGVLHFVRGVERLGQSLHKHGAKSDNTNLPFLRLPVPQNPDPVPISYAAFRRFLDDFHRDLSAAEATLAGVTDDNVKLPLRLAIVRLDLIGDGKPTDKFIDILKKIMQRQQFDFQKSNPDFLVCFDRGDVAWLRAYCHLLMGMLDFYLAFDTEELFDLSADELFAKPENRFQGGAAERQQKIQDAGKVITVKKPARLGQFRKHLIKVAELNRETWKHIRAETDDDHEWLPNPRQKGVLGLPVRDEMINAWLAMIAELEALLDGKRTFTFTFLNDPLFVKNGKGLNLKTLFDDPPEKFVSDGEFPQTLPEKYFSERRDVNIGVLFTVFQIFGDTTAVAYAAWFN